MDSNGNIWTKEDVQLVEKFIEIKNRGYYVDSRQLQNVYNRVLEKQLQPTNCGSCLRSRIQELENALNVFKKQMAVNADENNDKVANETVSSPSESKTKDEVMKERMAKVRAARKAKNE